MSLRGKGRGARPALHRTAALAALLTAGLMVGASQPALASTADSTATTNASDLTRIDPSQGQAAKPYLGWSSWSLESTNYPGVNPGGGASWLTEQHVLEQAQVVASTLRSHGYEYVNIDAAWSSGFDQYARPAVNKTRFPDGIAYVADRVHAEGLKLGIYMPVGLDKNAYNDGNTPIFGTTDCFTRDLVYPDMRSTNGWDSAYKIDFDNPCGQAYIDSMADMFAGWGVDYLKLDGVGPGSFKGGPNYDNTSDVAAWSKALRETGRPMQFTISWALSPLRSDVWSAYTNGWRIDTDVECYCNTLVTWNNSVRQRWNDVIPFIDQAGPGHWNNLDSLDVGVGSMDGLTDVERQSYMTLWAIEAAPLYSGDDLTKLDAYGKSLLTNDEVIAVDQAGRPARPVDQLTRQQTWFASNPDGSVTVGQFNLADSQATVSTTLSDIGLSGTASVRDLWDHHELGTVSGTFSTVLPAHGSRLLTFTPRRNSGTLAAPTRLHATGATPSSVDLAWDPSSNATSGTRYEVWADHHRVATVDNTQATVSGLSPVSEHTFQVSAVAGSGGKSSLSSAMTLTTPDADGPTVYEAEASTNRLTGSASIASCPECSGGAKIGNLGGSGYLTFTSVNVPKAGVYLMKMSYVDGDSSRQAILTANGGVPVYLNLVGTNNNDWGTPQTKVVPVALKAGTNSIQIGNPSDYVSDIDYISV